jgi:glycosyltransferase involved in cell wall biosynthesis
MTKVTYILSDVDHAPFFEHTFNLIDKNRFTISVILLASRKSRFEDAIEAMGITYEIFHFRGKKDYPKAIWKTFRFLRKVKPDIIHTHLADASMIGMIAAIMAGIKKRVYTRHGGTQKFYFDKGKKYDRAIHAMSSHIIATCENVKEVLMEEDHVAADKITIVNLAFEMDRFYNPRREIVKDLIHKYNPNDRHPVIGVISRWVGYKGINYIIEAFREVLKEYPDALLLLINARGNQIKEIGAMLAEFKPEQVRAVEFESNIYELYQVFDIFVHVPVAKHYEAFGQIYIEALAAGIPSVFTIAGIAAEFIRHEHDALVVDYRSADGIRDAIMRLMKDTALRNKIIENGKESVRGKFEFSRYIKALEAFYSKIDDRKKHV